MKLGLPFQTFLPGSKEISKGFHMSKQVAVKGVVAPDIFADLEPGVHELHAPFYEDTEYGAEGGALQVGVEGYSKKEHQLTTVEVIEHLGERAIQLARKDKELFSLESAEGPMLGRAVRRIRFTEVPGENYLTVEVAGGSGILEIKNPAGLNHLMASLVAYTHYRQEEQKKKTNIQTQTV